uniref:Uncharacterized protein n=1 Tax=Nelumbo nucifera TaxID=4432 RepID=A0A822YJV5_NELNU|nr:TPA_asm: hypothetical protein HUJ06_011721 [Nelumbo nucifera]
MNSAFGCSDSIDSMGESGDSGDGEEREEEEEINQRKTSDLVRKDRGKDFTPFLFIHSLEAESEAIQHAIFFLSKIRVGNFCLVILILN